jgi:hypothetical protein
MNLEDHVSSAVSNTGTPTILLSEKQRLAVVIRLRERMGVDVTSNQAWNGGASERTQRLDGWDLIPRYVGGRECLMFLEGARSIWKFRNGTDLLRVLEDCPTIEFYVSDKEASYLLCSNHHDFVIGWGDASRWVERLADWLPMEGA